MYLDGTLRASSPGIEGVGEVSKADDAINRQSAAGFDRRGGCASAAARRRTAGRASDGSSRAPPGAIWREERYFHGKVAHFAIWDDALSERQVNDLHASYVDQFNLQATPVDMPNGVREPLAYYYLDGHGTELKEAMTGYKGIDHGGGGVIFDPSVENNHGGGETAVDHRPKRRRRLRPRHPVRRHPCRRRRLMHRGPLSLTDVGYGHNGAWSLSVWLRHGPGFPGYSREQFLGHGNPNQYTGHRNQLHIQLEKLDLDANRFGHITTILFDDTDIDRYVGSNETLLRTIYDDAKMAELFPNGVDPDCFADRDCRGQFGASTNTGPLVETHNTKWHHLVLSTRPDGLKGYGLYVDGVLRAVDPEDVDGSLNTGMALDDDAESTSVGNGGRPFYPEGPIRVARDARRWAGITWQQRPGLPEDHLA